MALQTEIATESGLVAPQAYLRVGDLVHYKAEGEYVLGFSIAFYASAAAAAAGAPAIDPPRTYAAVPYDLEGANPYVQAYAHAKATHWPEAVDV